MGGNPVGVPDTGWGLLFARLLAQPGIPGGQTINAARGYSSQGIANASFEPGSAPAMVSGFGSGAMAALKAMDKLAEGINFLNDSTKSFGQRLEQIPFVKSVIAFGEALNNTEDKLRRIGLALEKDLEVIRQTTAGRTAIMQAQLASAEAASTVSHRQAVGIGRAGYAGIDRSTHFGEIDYRNAQAMDVARLGVRLADVNFRTASDQSREAGKNLDFANESLASVASRNADAREEYLEARKRVGGGIIGGAMAGAVAYGTAGAAMGSAIPLVGTAIGGAVGIGVGGLIGGVIGAIDSGEKKVKQEQAMAEWAKVNEEHKGRLLQQEAAINSQKEKGIALANAESALRKANLEVEKQSLAVVNERVSRMQGMQRNLGSMGTGEIEMGIAAVIEGKKHGFENMPAELRQLAETVAGGYVAKQMERIGGDRAPEIGRRLTAQGIGGDESDYRDYNEGRTLAGERRDATNRELALRVQVDADETKLAEKVAGILKQFGDSIVRLVEVKINQAVMDVEQRQRQAQNRG